MKYSGIKYPFFAIAQKPAEIRYDLNKIQIRRKHLSNFETLDDKSYGGDYFTRLLQMQHRVKFDFTCANLQELVWSDAKWGIDSTAKIFDLSAKERFITTKRKIVNIIDNDIWVEKISYPFRIKTNEKLSFDKDYVWAKLIKINKQWYLKEFFE